MKLFNMRVEREKREEKYGTPTIQPSTMGSVFAVSRGDTIGDLNSVDAWTIH